MGVCVGGGGAFVCVSAGRRSRVCRGERGLARWLRGLSVCPARCLRGLSVWLARCLSGLSVWLAASSLASLASTAVPRRGDLHRTNHRTNDPSVELAFVRRRDARAPARWSRAPFPPSRPTDRPRGVVSPPLSSVPRRGGAVGRWRRRWRLVAPLPCAGGWELTNGWRRWWRQPHTCVKAVLAELNEIMKVRHVM